MWCFSQQYSLFVKLLNIKFVCTVLHVHVRSLAFLFSQYRQGLLSVQSNLSITNPLRTIEKVRHIRVFTTAGCSLHQGIYYIRVFTTSGCSLHQGVHYIRVFTTSGYSLHQGVHYIRMFTTSGCSLHQGSFTIE